MIVRSVKRSSYTAISAASVCWTRASSGATPSGSTATTWLDGVVLLEERPQVWTGRADVAGGDQSATDRQQVRRQRDGEAERLRDLRHVLVLTHLVRGHVLEHETCVRARLERPSCAGHPRLGVDDHVGRVDRVADRMQSEQRRGRIAAGIRDEPTFGRRRPRADRSSSLRARCGRGCRKPYHCSYWARIGEPVGAREVDHDAVAPGLERRCLLVRQADEGDVRLAGESSFVRDEMRHAPPAVSVQSRVERDCLAAGKAVRSDRVGARARDARGRGRASPVRCNRRHR